MPVSKNFLEFVLDQLSGLGAVRSRRMFGGIGLYCDEFFFGLIDDDIVYFKVDDSNRADYTSRGCEAFRPLADDPTAVSMSYFRVPEDVLEDGDALREWAQKSVSIAAASAALKAARKEKSRTRAKSASAARRKRKRQQ